MILTINEAAMLISKTMTLTKEQTDEVVANLAKSYGENVTLNGVIIGLIMTLSRENKSLTDQLSQLKKSVEALERNQYAGQ